jgi:hypothetical protein
MLAVDLKNKSKHELSTTKDNKSSFSKIAGPTLVNTIIENDFTYCICPSVQFAINLHGINVPLFTWAIERLLAEQEDRCREQTYINFLNMHFQQHEVER